jgi:hypothetical protein
MKKNTCKYSDTFQPYNGGYNKYEYDIKLKSGKVILNCYPNSGIFHSVGVLSDDLIVKEEKVQEIRFSNEPILCINDGVSNISQEYYIDPTDNDEWLRANDKKFN